MDDDKIWLLHYIIYHMSFYKPGRNFGAMIPVGVKVEVKYALGNSDTWRTRTNCPWDRSIDIYILNQANKFIYKNKQVDRKIIKKKRFNCDTKK